MENQGNTELAIIRPSGQSFYFDKVLAKAYGIEEAILINHFQYWIGVNKTRNLNKREGRTWTYQTYQEIADHFPFLTLRQVRRTVDNLVHFGVIIKANFNKMPGDNTNWFAFNKEHIFIPDMPATKKRPPDILEEESNPIEQELQNTPLPKKADPCRKRQTPAEKGRAIPDNIPHNKPYNITTTNIGGMGEVGGFPKKEKHQSNIYPCLEKINIKQEDKIRFTTIFSEEALIKSISYCSRPDFKIEKSLDSSIYYFAKNPHHIAESKQEILKKQQSEEDIKEEKKEIRKLASKSIAKSLWNYCKDSNCLRIIDKNDFLYLSNERMEEKVYYNNDSFKNQVEHILRKFQLPIPKFMSQIP